MKGAFVMENYKKHNMVIGTVIGNNSHGCYVRDDKTDNIVFYYGNGMKGDKVQLSVHKVDHIRERVTYVLGSVLEYSVFAA